MNWTADLTWNTAQRLHEERVRALSRSWGPLLPGLVGRLRRHVARRSADRANRYDLAA